MVEQHSAWGSSASQAIDLSSPSEVILQVKEAEYGNIFSKPAYIICTLKAGTVLFQKANLATGIIVFLASILVCRWHSEAK